MAIKLKNKSILLISPESWDHIFVSKHHYAISLADKENRVYFLGPPRRRYGITPTEYDNVYQIHYTGFIPLLRKYPAIIRRKLTLKVFRKLEKIAKTKFDIVWSFDNSVFYDFNAVPTEVLKICHIVDLNQNFMVRQSSRTADICFGVTKEIVSRAKLANNNSFFINHGLNDSFQKLDLKVNLPGNNKIKVLYLGNLAMKHLDWETIQSGVQLNSKADFIFLGPNAENFDIKSNQTHGFKKEILPFENVYFLPKVKSEVIKNYLEEADILIVCYQEKYHLDQSNSHKIIEYLYSGKVVVATYTDEYAGTDLLQMSERNEEWPQLLSEVINRIEIHNEEKKQEERRKFALDNTYNMQLDRIEKLIGNL